MVAELWGLYLGIRLARELCLSPVIFEMDSQVVVLKGVSSINSLQPLLSKVIQLLQLLDWSTSVTHAYQEANRCTDLLADMGHGSSFSIGRWLIGCCHC